MHMIPNRTRDADTTRWALGLKTGNYVHRISVQVSPVSNCVTNVDADTEAHGPIGRLVTVEHRHPLLHLHGTAHRPVYAVEDNQQGVATCLDDPAAVLLYYRID